MPKHSHSKQMLMCLYIFLLSTSPLMLRREKIPFFSIFFFCLYSFCISSFSVIYLCHPVVVWSHQQLSCPLLCRQIVESYSNSNSQPGKLQIRNIPDTNTKCKIWSRSARLDNFPIFARSLDHSAHILQLEMWKFGWFLGKGVSKQK